MTTETSLIITITYICHCKSSDMDSTRSRPHIADVSRGRLVNRLPFGQRSLFTWEVLVPLFLPEAFVYRHNVTLSCEDVLVIRFVKWVVFIKQL